MVERATNEGGGLSLDLGRWKPSLSSCERNSREGISRDREEGYYVYAPSTDTRPVRGVPGRPGLPAGGASRFKRPGAYSSHPDCSLSDRPLQSLSVPPD